MTRRVVIVDDSRTVQAMLDNAFGNRRDFRVVGIAGDAESAVEIIRRLMPEIVTIDLCMPDPDGAALLEMIGDLTHVCKVIVSDNSRTDMGVTSRLMEAGAAACLGKSDLVRDPAGFFKKIIAASDAVQHAKRVAPIVAANDLPERAPLPPANDRRRAPPFPVPADETARLDFIRRKNLANAVRERQFDLITKHVATVTDFPACLLTFIDRDTQWIKSAHGFDLPSIPRDQAFCNYTISQPGTFVVGNATSDLRFARNPLVVNSPQIRSYAGHPITTADGVNVAALCVIDARVRTVSKHVLDELAGMASIIAELIDQRPTSAD